MRRNDDLHRWSQLRILIDRKLGDRAMVSLVWSEYTAGKRRDVRIRTVMLELPPGSTESTDPIAMARRAGEGLGVAPPWC